MKQIAALFVFTTFVLSGCGGSSENSDPDAADEIETVICPRLGPTSIGRIDLDASAPDSDQND